MAAHGGDDGGERKKKKESKARKGGKPVDASKPDNVFERPRKERNPRFSAASASELHSSLLVEADDPGFTRGRGNVLSRNEDAEAVGAEYEKEEKDPNKGTERRNHKRSKRKLSHDQDDSGSQSGEGVSGKLPRFGNRIGLEMERAFVPPLQVSLDDSELSDVDNIEVPNKDNMGTDHLTKNVDRHVKKRDRENRELEISANERRLLEKDMPQTIEDFEKLLRSSPDSSFWWIKYMAYMLSLADIEQARSIAERALKTINFREEGEKHNIWVAYFNLENEYGNPLKVPDGTDALAIDDEIEVPYELQVPDIEGLTIPRGTHGYIVKVVDSNLVLVRWEEAVEKIFQRALQYCDPERIHWSLLGVYERTEQHELAFVLLERMAKRFKNLCEVWVSYVKNLLKQQKDGIQSVIDCALLSLPHKKHIRFLSETAILEFKHGIPDRGRSMFESILREYPKRTDLWSIYLDQEIHMGNVEVTRALFERATCLSLPPKKMKFLLKKFLEYESSHGDEERIEYVKKKALEYVECFL